jgi:DNA-binding MarR family transcriptional regulator
MGVIGRLHRIGDRLHGELRAVFASAGLGDGDFDVLASLRRSGSPYELTPGELGATTMVTSSAVTKRIDRLERAGLVTRTISETDGRSRRIRLTDRGFDLIERLIAEHVANEQRLVAGLTPEERDHLADLLRRWGAALGE